MDGSNPVEVALRHRPDIRVCADCIDWLRQQSGAVDVTPILPVTDMHRAQSFYETAGFEVGRYDGGYAFVNWADRERFRPRAGRGVRRRDEQRRVLFDRA